MLVRRLVPSDAIAYQTLRLAGLRECPSAFSSSYEEECDTPLATIAGHMAPDSGRNRFGAFVQSELVGMLGIGRETARKLEHKASIRGMIVAAPHRGKGVGKLLLEHALAFAHTMEGLRQLTLAVTAGNGAAIALYESFGFHVVGHEPNAMLVDGVFYDEVQMLRELECRWRLNPS